MTLVVLIVQPTFFNCRYSVGRLGLALTTWFVDRSNHNPKPLLLCLLPLFSLSFIFFSFSTDWNTWANSGIWNPTLYRQYRKYSMIKFALEVINLKFQFFLSWDGGDNLHRWDGNSLGKAQAHHAWQTHLALGKKRRLSKPKLHSF